jgi:hypothetical protein
MIKVPSVPITLSFEDLLPDQNGEIVVVSTGDNPQLSILTDLRVRDAGIAASHVTADGVEVGGLAYYTRRRHQALLLARHRSHDRAAADLNGCRLDGSGNMPHKPTHVPAAPKNASADGRIMKPGQ